MLSAAICLPCLICPLHVMIRVREMPPIRGALIDLGGVVYEGKEAVPGSIEAIDRLERNGIALRFLTNTTSRPLSAILAKLHDLGVAASPRQVFTPMMAARTYIVAHDLEPHFLMQSSLEEDLQGIPTGTKPAVIVADARDAFSFRNLNAAFRRIQDGAELIALATNRMFVDDDGELSLDVGAFVAALEYASGRHAIVLGKPSAEFFHLAVADMGLEPAEVAMIGDDAEFDVAAAVKAGLSGILVRTGKWRPDSTDALEPQPTAVFDDLSAAARWLVAQAEPTASSRA